MQKMYVASRTLLQLLPLLGALWGVAQMPLAWAQGNVPVGMVDNPCPPPVAAPDMTAALDAMMRPGVLDPKLMASLNTPQAAAAYSKAQTEQRARDWPDLCHFRAANAALRAGPRPRVVFIGDSITEFWLRGDPGLFTHGVVNRGIGGQTSPQLLLRFYADVIALHPQAVHIMVGTNDVAGNTGPTTAGDYENNIGAMCELATAHGIKVLLASIPPAGAISWQPQLQPAPRIIELNAWLRGYASAHHLQYVDYHSALRAADGSLQPRLTHDGVHPHRDGYALMRPLAQRAIAAALARP